jgi:hypothetical protein
VKPRTLAILVVLAVLALGAGWYFGIAQEPKPEATADTGRLMFPDLAPHLADAAQVELEHGASTLRIVKDAKTGAWGLAERGGYPVDLAKLRGLLTALTELRLSERRTADPGEFARLGLEDPAGKDATSTLVQVSDSAGHPIAALIAGHSRVRTEGDLPNEVYVRRPDESQTWLAEGKLDVDTDALTWLDRDIVDIKPDRIATVSVTNGNSQLLLVRAGDKLTVKEPADHPPLDDEHLGDVQRALDLLSLEDVRPDKDAPKGDALGSAVFTTQDGLAITATPVKAGNDLWVRFSAAGTDDKAAAEASRLNARLAGWTYEIGSWKQKALVPSLDDLKAPPPPSPPPAPAPTPAPAKP